MCKATFVLPILLLIALSAPARDKYKVTRLGTLGGSSTNVLAINVHGQITGGSAIPGNAFQHAFLYTAGKIKDLGTLGATSVGEALNASAQVVGISYLSDDPNDRNHAFFYSKGVMTDLGLLGGTSSFAYSINDFGQVTICVEGAPEGQAFLYSAVLNSVFSLTDKLGSTACATAINNSGEMTGGYRDNSGAHAFLFSDGKRRDIGPSGTDFSFGFAINHSGRVAGNYVEVIDSQGNSTERVFLYFKGRTIDIGDLGGGFASVLGPSAINRHGHIVGVSTFSTSSGLTHAFLYTPRKGMVDLNRLMPECLKKIILSEARGINDRGQIIAVDNDSHSYLLTPLHEEKDEDEDDKGN